MRRCPSSCSTLVPPGLARSTSGIHDVGVCDDLEHAAAATAVAELSDARETAARPLRERELGIAAELNGASRPSMRDELAIVPSLVDSSASRIRGVLHGEGDTRPSGVGFGVCGVAPALRARLDAMRAAVAPGYRGPDGVALEVWGCEASAGVDLLQ